MLPKNIDVLKIDCEGCEYDIILNWLNDNFYKELIVEYHSGNEDIIKKLQSLGYKTKIFKPLKTNPNIGHIYAYV